MSRSPRAMSERPSSLPGRHHPLLLISIGSKNPAKTLGVKKAFKAALGDPLHFLEVDTGSVTKKRQPFGFAETLRGAKNRARFALQSRPPPAASSEPDFGVGVEAGILPASQGHLNMQLAAIVDRRGGLSIGSSAGFMLPREVVKRMQNESTELDHYAHELTGAPKVREVDGIIYHLSKGGLSRVEMTEQCVTMALVPWLNPKLYGLQIPWWIDRPVHR
jgi:inosine/xanthosine triphosphatase